MEENPANQSYNNIYERLVDDDPGLQGMIAYCYYKIAKREYILDFKRRNNRKPTEVEMDAYTQTWTDSRLDGVMTEAEKALVGYASFVIDQERPKIIAQTLRERSFLKDSLAGMTGAALWTMVLISLAFMLKYSHIDMISIFSLVGSPHETSSTTVPDEVK